MKFMFPILLVLRIIKIQIMYTSFRKLFMDLNKHQSNGVGLSHFLLEQNFERGQVDKMFSIKKSSHNTLLMQVYVDDIIFGCTNKSLCQDFVHKI